MKLFNGGVSALAVVAVLVVLCAPAQAATLFASGDGIGEWNNVTTTNVLIDPHSTWQPNISGGGQWISHMNTGVGGVVVPNSAGVEDKQETASFFETFYLGSRAGIYLQVWADDTAAVWLNGKLLQAANPRQDDSCADGVIGCTGKEGLWLLISASDLNFGDTANELRVAGYQREGNVFGVMYQGTSAVPEPTAMSLFGLGLIGLGLCRKFISRA